jgi:hypothetical protein
MVLHRPVETAGHFRSLEFLMSRHRVHRSGKSVSGLQIRQILQREATSAATAIVLAGHLKGRS